MKTGIELIAQERQEQIEKHGRTIEYDIETNDCEQLSMAACGLMVPNQHTHQKQNQSARMVGMKNYGRK